MALHAGIVGLPNVGKSTLFNALLSSAQAEAANYPFCTIEPNVGRAPVPDERLEKIAALAKSEQIIPTFLEFVDIAGLVRGASKGEGLGNQFLAHIREVDAILMVLRCFEDENITHVEGGIDPLRDKQVIETELLLADLQSAEKRLANIAKKAKGGGKEIQIEAALLEKLVKDLNDGKPARLTNLSDDEKPVFKQFQMLTAKPVLYLCNVEDSSAATGNALSQKIAEIAQAEKSETVVISAKIESEVATLGDDAEKKEFLEALGLSETGLARVIRAGYKLMDLLTFFTAGPKETRAWTVKRGSSAPQAAGVIHTDFEKGFIRAETIAYADYVAHKGEQGAKEAGKLRLEGKDYKVADGDLFHFRFNV